MATREKLYSPKDDKKAGRYVHVRHNPKTGRYDVDVRFTRADGSVFRRASSAETLPDALRAREAAYLEWFRDQGEAKDEQRKKRKEPADTLRSWTERVLPIIQSQVAPATFEAYGHALDNHVLPALGASASADVGGTGTATVSVEVSSSASSSPVILGEAAAAVSLTVATGGSVDNAGAAVAQVSLSGSAAGLRAVNGSAPGALALVTAGAAHRQVHGSAAANVSVGSAAQLSGVGITFIGRRTGDAAGRESTASIGAEERTGDID